MVIKTYYINETHVLERYCSKTFELYFKDSSICVLDIETTGISPETSHFVLGSLLSFDEGGKALLRQYFAEGLSEEKALLVEYMEDAARFDVVLTYNGKGFDMPYLFSRMKKLGLDIDAAPYNLDLYLVLNGYSPLRKFLPNLRQKTVEDFMGFWHLRKDKISGSQMPALYPKYRDLMLLHNSDDVLQLGRLLPVLEKVDFHRAMHVLGFPVITGTNKVHVKRIKLEGNSLNVSGIQTSCPVGFAHYGDAGGDCYIRFVRSPSTFEISFPLIKKSHAMVVDLLKLPFDMDGELSSLPNYESGYLILKDGGDTNYHDINMLVKTFLVKILDNIPEDYS